MTGGVGAEQVARIGLQHVDDGLDHRVSTHQLHERAAEETIADRAALPERALDRAKGLTAPRWVNNRDNHVALLCDDGQLPRAVGKEGNIEVGHRGMDFPDVDGRVRVVADTDQQHPAIARGYTIHR
jgi:hypothetical protein